MRGGSEEDIEEWDMKLNMPPADRAKRPATEAEAARDMADFDAAMSAFGGA